MRIREHSKISPLIYPASSLKLPGTLVQTYVCQLNQSPWDVMNFSPPSTPTPQLPPPPHFQVNGNDSFGPNGSLGDSIAGAIECDVSMKIAVDDKVTGEMDEYLKWDYSDGIDKAEDDEAKEIIWCCKTDGKGWKCKREAARGNSLCEHHLSLVRNYSNSAYPAKKLDKTAAVPSQRRPWPKEASKSSTWNPYEFYYYSGFGPRWGKKRGVKNKIGSTSRKVPKTGELDRDMTQSSLTQLDNEEFDSNEEIENEQEDEENGASTKKRARKPIKARSLKSLM